MTDANDRPKPDPAPRQRFAKPSQQTKHYDHPIYAVTMSDWTHLKTICGKGTAFFAPLLGNYPTSPNNIFRRERKYPSWYTFYIAMIVKEYFPQVDLAQFASFHPTLALIREVIEGRRDMPAEWTVKLKREAPRGFKHYTKSDVLRLFGDESAEF